MSDCSCGKQYGRTCWQKHGLLLATALAIILGLVFGFGLRPLNLSSDVIMWIGIWGELFIRMVKMLMLPLIVINLILGVSSLEAKASGRLGVVSMLYIISTQLIGGCIGVALGFIVKPGTEFAQTQDFKLSTQPTNFGDVFADIFRNLFPTNLVEAAFQQVRTVRTADIVNATWNITKEGRELTIISGMNAIGLTLFCILFGIGTVAVGEPAQPFITMLKGINDVVFWLLKLVTWYSPLGITSLISAALLEEEDLIGAMTSLGWLVLCVVIGCLFHQLIVLHLLYLIIVRKNPYKYTFHIFDGMLAGFSPPTSMVALPYLFKDCEEKLHIDKRVTKFFLPLAITMNRDGSSMFICLCSIFVTQTFGVTLNAATTFAIMLVVSTLTLALASVPSGSVIVLLMLTSILQVPVAERVGLIMTVEWINDRLRTQVNVMSHGFGCGIVERLVKKHLPPDKQETETMQCPENNVLIHANNIYEA